MKNYKKSSREQVSVHAVDSRWNATALIGEVRRAHRIMVRSHAVVTNQDFEDVIDCPGDAFLYLDPPYYVKGGELYQHAFQHEDHLRLAACLERSTNPWLLSYDDAPEIRELYKFAEIRSVSLNYTISGAREKSELLICPRSLAHLFDSAAEKNKEQSGTDIFED